MSTWRFSRHSVASFLVEGPHEGANRSSGDAADRLAYSARSAGHGTRPARRVARFYLGYGEGNEAEQNSNENAKILLEQYSWNSLIDQGVIRQLHSINAEGVPLTLSFTYMGRRALGEYFIGASDYELVESDASFRATGDEMMLIAPSGPGAGESFRQFPMSVRQGDLTRYVAGNRYSSAGNGSTGAIAGNAPYGVALIMHPDFDVTEPFTLIYHPPGSDDEVSVDYSLSGVGLTLARNELVLSEEELLAARLVNASFITRLRLDPPWGVTPMSDVILLFALLTLVMAAFLTKKESLRWAALTATLFYLGFYKNGFLSISHFTSVIKLGPEALTNNLTTLSLRPSQSSQP